MFHNAGVGLVHQLFQLLRVAIRAGGLSASVRLPRESGERRNGGIDGQDEPAATAMLRFTAHSTAYASNP